MAKRVNFSSIILFEAINRLWSLKLSCCLSPELHVRLLLLPPPTRSYWSSHPAKVSSVIAVQSRDLLHVCINPPAFFFATGKAEMSDISGSHIPGWRQNAAARSIGNDGLAKQGFLEQRNNRLRKMQHFTWRGRYMPAQLWKQRLWSLTKKIQTIFYSMRITHAVLRHYRDAQKTPPFPFQLPLPVQTWVC